MSSVDLSIIIVNYNVKHFLEQCLLSVVRASKQISAEIIVVDNHSHDGSVEMVSQKFPSVRLITSPVNLGFSKGNNLAIEQSQGEFILLLNPDTLVEEDTFKKIVTFAQNTTDLGGLGVRMLDGKGRFLPESKRGLPTPDVAFYKMFGLSKLFPKSKQFGKYHLTYLNEYKTNEVDVLSGAFMMVRKTVVDKIGLLDETFFMYGEDIDYSYRIQLAGFKNYYFPETSIIHYKGESTKKTSVNYVFVFYKAMIIFARKHFTKNNAFIFGLLIHLAIYIRAVITLIVNFFRLSYLAIVDFILLIIALNLVLIGYNFYTSIEPPESLIHLLFPLYTCIWILSSFFSGAYDKPILLKNYVKGIAVGTGLILVFYSLLPESYRFSRAIILMGALGALFFGLILRYLLNYFEIFGFKLGTSFNRRFAIVGSESEINRVLLLLKNTTIQLEFIAKVCTESSKTTSDFFVGHISRLREITKIFNIQEVIFCAENVETKMILEQMSQLDDAKLDYKIAPPESLFVIGSNSINTSGELYSVITINAIGKSKNLRNKRIIDLLFSSVCLLAYPILAFFQKNPKRFLRNITDVIVGQKTWVGYNESAENLNDLPMLKKGIINSGMLFNNPSKNQLAQINVMYAKDYKPLNDLTLLVKKWKGLGN